MSNRSIKKVPRIRIRLTRRIVIQLTDIADVGEKITNSIPVMPIQRSESEEGVLVKTSSRNMKTSYQGPRKV